MGQNLESLVGGLSPEDLVILRWHLQRRPSQHPPDPLPFILMWRAGRGAGKTWTAVNHIFEYTKNFKVNSPQDRIIRVGFVGETSSDVKHTMIEGDSGILNVIPAEQLITWNRTMGELKYVLLHPTRREVHIQAYSSEKPDQLRGPQHHLVWVDEIAKLRDSNEEPLKAGTTFSNLMMGLRLGERPHLVVTGTPTPCALVRHLDAHPKARTITMSSLDNRANVAGDFIDSLESLDKTSRLYRQEVLGEIVYDVPDALFTQSIIDTYRSTPRPDDALSLVLGYDPAVSSDQDGDESGIVLVGHHEVGGKAHGYVLADYSGHYTPKAATSLVIDLILKKNIKTLAVELNQGLSFVMTTIEQAIKEKTSYKLRRMPDKKAKYGKIQRWKVITPSHLFYIEGIQSTQGKQLRAEPVSIAYEYGLVHHAGALDPLEEQMTSWSPQRSKDSPDRLDALVFALLSIFGEGMKNRLVPSRLIVPPATPISELVGPRRNPYDFTPGRGTSTAYNLDL